MSTEKPEPEEATGSFCTQIDCPCGEVFVVEGDADGDVVSCPACETELKVRRI